MNPGFMSWILIVVSLILLASGWKNSVLRSISDRSIVLFFAAWCLLSRFHFNWGGAEIYPIAFLLLMNIVLSLWRRQTIISAIHFVSFGLFLASIYYLLKHLGDLDPFFLPFQTSLGTSAAVALMAAMLVRRANDQIGCISFALLLGWVLYGTVHREQAGFRIGDFTDQDEWWLAVVMARGVSVAAESAAAIARAISKRMSDRWRG